MIPDPLPGKLPKIAAAFWIMKISATTLGETAGDLLSMTIHVGYAVSSLILLSAFLVSLIAQLLAPRYLPPLYWLVILATSTAGTTISDYMDRTLGFGYATGSAILIALLVGTLVFWRISMGSLSVDHVRSRKAELLYWIAILFSNTLGTALGDYLSDSSGLGFAGGALLIGGILALILAATYLTRISRIALFWLAFILTRPFGATIGDVLTKAPEQGGVGLGTIGSSAILAAILVVFVAIETRRGQRIEVRAVG